MTAALRLRPPRPDRPLGTSPFGPAAPSIVLAMGYLLAVVVWLVGGPALPGGRWLAVHLFTLGVLTNLVLTFSEHFARTVTRTAGERAPWWPLVTNAGILLVLVGLPAGRRWLLAVGSTVVTAAVLAAYRRIRRMRRQAIGARFAWVARAYERAHGAFVHGAVLGAVVGVGLLPGAWYAAGRTAHLHAMVLGWGGLTLLATLVFFGPSMARTRIEAGADGRSARALRHGATGLSVALVLLVLTGLGGTAGTAARWGAAAGLAAYAAAATVVCLPVARAVRGARVSAVRPLLLGVWGWLPLVVWADVLVVATGAWRWLDGLGVAALAGVLAPAIMASLVYLAPMLRGRSTGARDVIRRRLETLARTRAVAVNVGVLAAVVGALRLVDGVPLLRIGWGLVATAVLTTAVAALLPARS